METENQNQLAVSQNRVFTNVQAPRAGALKASRPQVLSDGMIPLGSTIKGTITGIRRGEKFKDSYILELRGESGMEFAVPLWASIAQVLGKTDKDLKDAKGKVLWLTKMGVKKSVATGKDFQVFDVVLTEPEEEQS